MEHIFSKPIVVLISIPKCPTLVYIYVCQLLFFVSSTYGHWNPSYRNNVTIVTTRLLSGLHMLTRVSCQLQKRRNNQHCSVSIDPTDIDNVSFLFVNSVLSILVFQYMSRTLSCLRETLSDKQVAQTPLLAAVVWGHCNKR